MPQLEKRKPPETVQMTFVATKELRHAAKLRALRKEMSVREYLSDLVLRDLQAEKEEATK